MMLYTKLIVDTYIVSGALMTKLNRINLAYVNLRLTCIVTVHKSSTQDEPTSWMSSVLSKKTVTMWESGGRVGRLCLACTMSHASDGQIFFTFDSCVIPTNICKLVKKVMHIIRKQYSTHACMHACMLACTL